MRFTESVFRLIGIGLQMCLFYSMCGSNKIGLPVVNELPCISKSLDDFVPQNYPVARVITRAMQHLCHLSRHRNDLRMSSGERTNSRTIGQATSEMDTKTKQTIRKR